MRVTSRVRAQLIAFWSAALVATVVLALVFLRVPEALGINRYVVHAQFEQGAGIYEGAEVTYRGHPVGKVSSLRLEDDRIVADLKLVDDTSVPAGVRAEIHSRSAVGEQYVDLVPPADAPAAATSALADGDVIGLDRTSSPVEIGPVLDNVYALIESVDPDRLGVLIDETGRAFYGRTGDLQAILDGTSDLIDLADANLAPTKRLIEDADPLLSTLNGKASRIRALTANVGQVTDELRAGDEDLRRLLRDGPGFSEETTRLVDDLGETLPPLLAQFTPVSQVLATYNPYLASILSEYPRSVATVQSVTLPHLDGAYVGLTLANADDPPECTQGFVPPERWTSPFDESPRETPLVYCTLPQDDPRGVRGARNVPCPNDPAVRRGDASLCPD